MRPRPYEYLVSLGSNLEPEAAVPQALALLRSRFELIALSPRYDVEAVGVPAAPRFVNMAIRMRSDLTLRPLRCALRRIEEACGRRRGTDRFAPRPMDLDPVFAAPGVPGVDLPGVGALPHPDLLAQAYVLCPCAAAWPTARHPQAGMSLRDLAQRSFPTWERTHRSPSEDRRLEDPDA